MVGSSSFYARNNLPFGTGRRAGRQRMWRFVERRWDGRDGRRRCRKSRGRRWSRWDHWRLCRKCWGRRRSRRDHWWLCRKCWGRRRSKRRAGGVCRAGRARRHRGHGWSLRRNRRGRWQRRWRRCGRGLCGRYRRQPRRRCRRSRDRRRRHRRRPRCLRWFQPRSLHLRPSGRKLALCERVPGGDAVPGGGRSLGALFHLLARRRRARSQMPDRGWLRVRRSLKSEFEMNSGRHIATSAADIPSSRLMTRSPPVVRRSCGLRCSRRTFVAGSRYDRFSSASLALKSATLLLSITSTPVSTLCSTGSVALGASESKVMRLVFSAILSSTAT